MSKPNKNTKKKNLGSYLEIIKNQFVVWCKKQKSIKKTKLDVLIDY
jgi:hypothetical protein